MILLTGGAGFIGSNVAADLNNAGRTDVIIADTLGSDGKWRNIAKRRFADIIAPGDIKSYLHNGISAVIHMGANSSTTAVDADAIVESNLRCSMQLWEWCTRNRVPLIYASSAATYGDGTSGFLDDDSKQHLDRLQPLNLYGWSKHAFDKWAVERAQRGHAPPQWAGLKFFNVYGPNESHKGEMQSLVAKMAHPIAQGQVVTLFKSHKNGFADGEQLRDFVYVRDCAAVIMWLLSNPHVSGLYNLGTGKARSFRDLIQAIAAALDRKVAIEYTDMPLAIRNQYQYFTEANISKLSQVGYSIPFYSIEEGVRDYVQNYLMRADIYR